MAKQSKTHTPTNTHNPSALDKFSLSFEYNVSWDKAGQTVQHRPNKK